MKSVGTIIFVLLLLAKEIECVKKDESFTMADVDKEINTIRDRIAQLDAQEGNNIEKAQEWGMLAILLQVKDARYHTAGGQSMKFETLATFKKALAYIEGDPDPRLVRLRVSFNHRMGMLLRMMGRGEEAVAAHKFVYEHSEHSYDRCLGLYYQGEALSLLGRIREASELYRAALSVRPDYLMIYHALVRVLRELNELTSSQWRELLVEMRREFKVWQKNPTEPAFDAEAWTYMPQSLETEILWAIFEVAEKIGEYDVAWSYLQQAHEQEKQKHIPYNPQSAISKTNTITSIFTRGFFPDLPLGIDSMLPVFIVGMMRSGSTLTETMLDAHVNVWGMGEESILGPYMVNVQKDLVRIMPMPDNTEILREALVRHGTAVVAAMRDSAERANAGSGKTLNVTRVVDKMLFNYRNIGFIHLLFPNAVILHTMRDPLDTILSCYKHKFGDQESDWTLDPVTLVNEYVQYMETMHHWRQVLPGRVHDVRYEEMVKNPEKTIRGVIDKLELDWDPNVLEFYKTNRTVQTMSMSQVRHNVYSKSVGAWRRYAKHMKPFIDAFNRVMPDMRARGVLPFVDEMNWNFDPDFDYGFGPVETKPQKVTAPKDGEKVCKDSESGECSTEEESSKVSQSKSKKRKTDKKRKTTRKGKSKKEKKEKKERPPKKEKKQKKKKASKKAEKKAAKKLLSLRKSVEGAVDWQVVKSMSKTLSYKSGESELDELVAAGYALVNNQKYSKAIELFRAMFEIRRDVPAAYIAYGTACAMAQKFPEAVAAFGRLIDHKPEAYEGYDRRSEVLQAMGKLEEATADLTHLIDNNLGDRNAMITALIRRGKISSQRQAPKMSCDDFHAALKLIPESDVPKRAQIFHLLGKSERELGFTDRAIVTQKDAIRLQPRAREFYLELSICYMEISDWQGALPHVGRAIQLEPRYKLAYGYRALLFQNLGRPTDALVDIQKAIDLDPDEPSGMLLKAVCLNYLGRMIEAFRTYDRMLELDPKNDCYFMREMAYFYYAKMDEDVWTFNADNAVDKKVKEGWSRRLDYTEMFPVGYVSPLQKAARKKMSEEGDRPVAMTAAMRELLRLTAPISKWIQLDTPGFMPNERQHRQYAMAVVQMAQCLRQHTRLLQAGEEGLLIPDVAASSKNWFGFTPSKTKPGFHVFGWRDMFDIALRWRQVSEPMDRVWWNDRLEIKAGYNELALKTHMHSGWGVVVRYGSYIPMGLNITKTLLLSDPEVNAKKGKAIRAASSVEELFKASGGKSFYVRTLVHSLAKPGEAWEGTQVTLRTSTSPEGYDFLINSIVNPARDAQYAQDMDFTFRSFVSSLGAVLAAEGGDPAASDAAFGHALEIFYYWVNYAALTRGTSATGYAALMACVVAMGEQILSPVPKGKQLDWEGIYTMHPADFVHRIKGWLSERDVSNIPKKWLDSEPGYSLTREVFSTTRSMMAVIGKLE